MADSAKMPKNSAENHPSSSANRCSNCDTRNAHAALTCVGCGKRLNSATSKRNEREVALGIVEADSKQRRRYDSTGIDITALLLRGITLIVIAAAIWAALQLRQPPEPIALSNPTATPLATESASSPAATETPFPTLTPSPAPSNTPPPTGTPLPTETPTPVPTPTLEPPLSHQIQDGEALYNISLRYAVSVDSIIALNPGLSPERIVSGTTIQVPQPTATPPLEPVLVALGEDTIVADPTDCQQHEIQEADTFFGIARLYGVPIDALLVMNRLSAETLLTPGDTVCIPSIIYNATSVEAGAADYGGRTDGEQIQLLFPPDSAEIQPRANALTLQWLADRPLDDTEWYMVEVTNLSSSTARPERGFTKSTSFQIPDAWRPDDTGIFRWRVSYVIATGERSDGSFVYTFGGPSSESRFSLTP